jgi:hypothetical protein
MLIARFMHSLKVRELEIEFFVEEEISENDVTVNSSILCVCASSLVVKGGPDIWEHVSSMTRDDS